MKLIVKMSCLLLVSSVILSSCSTNENKCNHKIEKTNCYPNNEKPSNVISYKEMASMFKEYDNGQKVILDKYIATKTKGRDSIATISQFFSLSELKQYIAYVEKLSKEKDIKLTGIKIFTAAYPSDYEKKEYRNRVSFILAPTANIGDKKNVAYEPLKSEKGKPVSMKSILDKYADKTTRNINRASIFALKFKQNDDELSSALNRGELAPPFSSN